MKSGWRAVLAFNLVWKAEKTRKAVVEPSAGGVADAHELFKRWAESVYALSPLPSLQAAPPLLAIPLEHEYTEANTEAAMPTSPTHCWLRAARRWRCS